jgi:enterochelin esterase-like enzyme
MALTRRSHRTRIPALLAGIALAALVTDVAAGRLTDDIRIESKVLGYALQYRVYVPDGAPGQALRTLYVTDGSWYLEQGRMKAVLDEMIAAGRIEPVIAVFVDARNPDHLDDNRRNQQLICKLNYASFFSTELVPTIDATYPTRRSPVSRTILGLSFGGLNAACFGLSIPHVFSNLAMQSPASGEMLRIVADEYRRNERLPLRMFLSVGTRNDNTDDGRRFRRILEDKGYPLTYSEVSQGHNWNNWGPLLPEVLATFYGRP